MEKIMTYETLRSFAYVNDGIVKHPIRGIVLSFFGLGGDEMFSHDTRDGKYYAERGILYVVPYYNPWSWMNRQAVAYTDEIVEVLLRKYSLPDSIPVVSTGGSMGGLSALVYTRYARITPAACITNCPVCDAVFHYTERPDLPRTLYSALGTYDGTLDEALRSISPLHLTPTMPKDTAYHVFHCDEDGAVNIDSHSERFVAAMKDAGFNVRYTVCHGRNHCDLTEELWADYLQTAVDEIAAAEAAV